MGSPPHPREPDPKRTVVSSPGWVLVPVADFCTKQEEVIAKFLRFACTSRRGPECRASDCSTGPGLRPSYRGAARAIDDAQSRRRVPHTHAHTHAHTNLRSPAAHHHAHRSTNAVERYALVLRMLVNLLVE